MQKLHFSRLMFPPFDTKYTPDMKYCEQRNDNDIVYIG